MTIEQSSITLLVVESNTDAVSRTHELLLTEENITIEVANTLAQAREKLHEKPFAAILLAFNLTDSSGFNTFLTIHREAKNTPIIILTSGPEKELTIAAMHAGAQDFLLKNAINIEHLKRAISFSREPLPEFIEKSSYGMAIIDHLEIKSTNAAFLKLVDASQKNTLLGEQITRFIPDLALKALCEDLPPNASCKVETALLNAPLPTDVLITATKITETTTQLLVQDITELKLKEKDFEHLALYDPLTGLINRYLHVDRIEQAIAYANREKCFATLLYVDIDDFKKINETHGHLIGDKLLQQIALRLKKNVRNIDSIVRMGADEFLIVCSRVKHQADSYIIAKNLVAAMTEPFLINDISMSVSASIGVSVYPGNAYTSQSLLEKTIQAVKLAKEAGKNTFIFSK